MDGLAFFDTDADADNTSSRDEIDNGCHLYQLQDAHSRR